MNLYYDVIVIGAGHAGSEAAAAAANLGVKTLLITADMTKIAQMSCNPAVGGIAKGQIVREIDALGGYMGVVSDITSIQFRMLNLSKGPAMWSPRVQSDRMKFTYEWRHYLEKLSNLDFWQDMAVSLIFEKDTVTGVKTAMGLTFSAKTIVLTNGTFLNGLMHIGAVKLKGGRIAEPASYGISEQIKDFGIPVGRMKTGTPARIDGRSVNFSILDEQKGDEKPRRFSFLPYIKNNLKQRSCFITHTNEEAHEILRTGFALSPLFNGTIKGIGPRYCPSIEDKIVTFSERNSHHLFLEPEGEFTEEYYINGFSSSLPLEVQYKALRKIKGLENVKIFRPGYAIEYDYFDPSYLNLTLESKNIKNLYFGGQVNGTTGYEEAAAQGLIAGINAALRVKEKDEFILRRDEAYIGVLIDDLITKGVDEPYRMFTSRAEFRILLRQDNSDLRLTPLSHKIGLASDERMKIVESKEKSIKKTLDFINNFGVEPEEMNPKLREISSAELTQKRKISTLLLRPEISIFFLKDNIGKLNEKYQNFEHSNDDIFEQAEILVKYEGYIEREKIIADKLQRLEYVKIPEGFIYENLESLSTEARQKFTKQKPKTIGLASRIPGVSPSDINVLLVFLGR
jgi:tRNA uridine 5-carboxymethylaminomethyl modification enzyme